MMVTVSCRWCWFFHVVGFFLPILSSVQSLNDSVQSHPKFQRAKGRVFDHHYVVVFKESSRGVFNARQKIQAEADFHMPGGESDGSVQAILFSVLIGFTFSLHPDLNDTRQEQILFSMLNRSHVAYVEQAGHINSLADEVCPGSWGLDRVDQNTSALNGVYHYDFDGTNIDAYVLDTGILNTNVQFDGRVTCGQSFVPDEEPCDDGFGHGTHVAGTIGSKDYGIAKNISLIAVKVLRNSDGVGSTTWICAGINWAAAEAAQSGKRSVINMSLGGAGSSSCMNDAIQTAAINNGVFTAVAAGNEADDACGYTPASSKWAVTVGATTTSDGRASFSNYGDCLDIFAPGVSITSTWSSSDTATATISGTSMATPHVTGIAALYWEENSTLTVRQLQERLKETAVADVVEDALSNNNYLAATFAGFTTTPIEGQGTCVSEYSSAPSIPAMAVSVMLGVVTAAVYSSLWL